MQKVTRLIYHFSFRWHDNSGQYWDYSVVITTLDSRESDKDAYRRAFISFASSFIFKLDFIAPESLIVKMRKEIVKELISDDTEEKSLLRD